MTIWSLKWNKTSEKDIKLSLKFQKENNVFRKCTNSVKDILEIYGQIKIKYQAHQEQLKLAKHTKQKKSKFDELGDKEF